MASILLPTRDLSISNNKSSINSHSQRVANVASGINNSIPFTVSPSKNLALAETVVNVIDAWDKRTRQNKLDLLQNEAKNSLQRELNDNLVKFQENKGKNAIDAYNDFQIKNKQIQEQYSGIFVKHNDMDVAFKKSVNDTVNRANIEGKNYYSKVVSEQAKKESFSAVQENLNTASLNYNSPLKAQYEQAVEDSYAEYLERYEGIVRGSAQEQVAQRELKDQYIANAIGYQITTKNYGLANANLEREKLDNLSANTYWKLKGQIALGIEAENKRREAESRKSFKPLTIPEQERAKQNLAQELTPKLMKDSSVWNGELASVLEGNEEYNKGVQAIKEKISTTIPSFVKDKEKYLQDTATYLNTEIDKYTADFIQKNKSKLTPQVQDRINSRAYELATRSVMKENMVRMANENNKIAMQLIYGDKIINYAKNNPLSSDEMINPLKVIDKVLSPAEREELNNYIISNYGADSDARKKFTEDLLGYIDLQSDSYTKNNDDLLLNSQYSTLKYLFKGEDGNVSINSILETARLNGWKFSNSALNNISSKLDKINTANEDNSRIKMAVNAVTTTISSNNISKQYKTAIPLIAKRALDIIAKSGKINEMSEEELRQLLFLTADSDMVKAYGNTLIKIKDTTKEMVEDLIDDRIINNLMTPERAEGLIFNIALKYYEEKGEIPSYRTLEKLIDERDLTMKSPISKIKIDPNSKINTSLDSYETNFFGFN